MNDFFAENNTCGQTLLNLVARGNALIAELLRLKDYVPKIFRLENKQELQKYGDIIMDFSYFKVAEVLEQKIDNNNNLRDLDEGFRDNHIEIISRFYLAFESIHTYVTDLNHFLEELDEGLYIHQSIETIFADVEGRQVMCEALYLYGVMLLVVDVHIEGIVRERLLVSYYRYTPQRLDTRTYIDEVCKLLRDTGYNSTKRPSNYPEDFFKRIPINSRFVEVVVGRLRSDDIYNQLATYPLPKHRSTALATQAAMLYVTLFFLPNILHNQTAIMREIVDKYFPDNWVISIYIGLTVNLAESWEAFKAARMALNNTLESVNIMEYASVLGSNVVPLLRETTSLLKEGSLTSENVINDINNITSILRECNFTVRWLMLHTTLKPGKSDRNKRCKQLRELVMDESNYSAVPLFKLLLNTAQLELTTREIIKDLLVKRDKKWDQLKKDSFDSLVELSEVFSGIKPLTRIEKNTNLQRWFSEISKEVDTLDQSDSNSGRKIVQLIQALEEVQEFHQLNKNMQVVQYLSETRKFMHQMIKNMNVKEDMLITLQIIGDVTYAWELIDSFTPIMQTGIKKDPTLCIKLRAVFLKLASALETPLLRINEAHSEDLISVSEYYSGELEAYIRKVLQIIPKMMFEKMARIIEIQTCVLKELPIRLEKDKLKEYAQLNERFEFAELTHSVSVYSQGMRMMKSTLVGVVCLDPKQLLEDGIRKELVQHISNALHAGITFTARPKNEELELCLKNLARIMDGYKRSFEYIQDYVNINGLKIWQEEVTRIINFNVEQECNGFLRNKVHAWESIYQSRYVPIPYHPSTDGASENFVGRLARELIRITNPRNSIYVEQTSTWYDAKSHKPILNKQAFALIASAIEITGLVGLDKLFSFMIVTDIQKILEIMDSKDKNKTNAWTNITSSLINEIDSFQQLPNINKFYQNCVNRTTKIWPNFLERILSVGQLQLLRVMCTFQLNLLCKFNAKDLEGSLSLVNNALLIDVRDKNLSLNSDVLLELSRYFDWAGINNPLHKIYVTARSPNDFVLTMVLFVMAHLVKLFVLKGTGSLSKRTQDLIDGVPFMVAVHTLFKQFNPKLNEMFIKHMSEFVMEVTKQSIESKNMELPPESVLGMRFLEMYSMYLKSSREFLLKYMPEEIMHLHECIVNSPYVNKV